MHINFIRSSGKQLSASLKIVQRIRNPFPENKAESESREDAWFGRGAADGSVRFKCECVWGGGARRGVLENKAKKRGGNKK